MLLCPVLPNGCIAVPATLLSMCRRRRRESICAQAPKSSEDASVILAEPHVLQNMLHMPQFELELRVSRSTTVASRMPSSHKTLPRAGACVACFVIQWLKHSTNTLLSRCCMSSKDMLESHSRSTCVAKAYWIRLVAAFPSQDPIPEV